MDDFEIEIIEEDVKENSSVQLPMNYLLIGEIENDDAKVYIKQDVYKALEEYALSDTSHELGTIILGKYSDDLGKMNIVISDFIYAKYTDASASTLTFTHETWDYVHKEHEEKYPETKMVGWQHTHPGYGIFLSNYDMFIQENFFNMPFQVAYVIDPIQHIRGFFQWKNGKVEKLKGFYIYDEIGKQIKIDNPKEKNIGVKSATVTPILDSKSSIVQSVILCVLCLAVLGLLVSTMSLHKRYNRQTKDQEILEQQLAEQNMLLGQQAMEIEAMKSNTTDFANSGDTGETVQEMPETEDEVNEPASCEIQDDRVNQTELTDNRVYFASYIVEVGDSLYSICKKNGLDYSSTYRIILSMNGIEDANQIFVGQTILLPCK